LGLLSFGCEKPPGRWFFDYLFGLDINDFRLIASEPAPLFHSPHFRLYLPNVGCSTRFSPQNPVPPSLLHPPDQFFPSPSALDSWIPLGIQNARQGFPTEKSLTFQPSPLFFPLFFLFSSPYKHPSPGIFFFFDLPAIDSYYFTPFCHDFPPVQPPGFWPRTLIFFCQPFVPLWCSGIESLFPFSPMGSVYKISFFFLGSCFLCRRIN